MKRQRIFERGNRVKSLYVVALAAMTQWMATAAVLTAQQPVPDSVRVTAQSGANVRFGPGAEHPVVVAVPFNAVLEILRVDGAWFEVRLPPAISTGASFGYISGTVVEVIIVPQPAPPEPETEPDLPAEASIAEPAMESVPQQRMPNDGPRSRVYSISAARSIDDLAHTGAVIGVRFHLFRALFLEPRIGVGVGSDHLAYLGQLALTYEGMPDGAWGWFVTAGYGAYGERSTGDGPQLTRTAFGPQGGGGLLWRMSDRVGLQIGAAVTRVAFDGDRYANEFSATVPHIYLGVLVAR